MINKEKRETFHQRFQERAFRAFEGGKECEDYELKHTCYHDRDIGWYGYYRWKGYSCFGALRQIISDCWR